MNRLICFVDKTGEPQHSFIDGMLANEIADDFKVIIYSSWSSWKNFGSKQYYRSELRGYLFPRKGLLRFLNIFLVALICIKYSLGHHKHKVTFFCRNEPSFLFGVYLASMFKNIKYIFQSSFPHEEVGKGLKGFIAKSIFLICGGKVKKITAVSDKGLERISKYFPNAKGMVMPLMADHLVSAPPVYNNSLVRFIYIGTLDITREFEIFLDAFYDVLQSKNYEITVDVYGGSDDEWQRSISRAKNKIGILQSECIKYRGNIPRNKIFSLVEKYDVGISLVPMNDITAEMSPTKLSEYMGCGLAVLASNTVPSQVKILNLSACGVLTEFGKDDIASAIKNLCKDKRKLLAYKLRAYRYAKKTLMYNSAKPMFVEFLKE